ncbi:MAG TPA: phenylalanine--tRNA ligase subunit alpha [Gemmatimonadales bacterium]|nr:phenylalanine--tRNA ligase subunit alpha [Gemmatimonadales bacterium]
MQRTGIPDLDALLPRLAAVGSLDAAGLEAEHTAVLGRKAGVLTQLAKRIPDLAPGERRSFGAAVNQVKVAFEAAFDERRVALAEDARRRAAGQLDRTMPARHRWTGSAHPVTRTIADICGIFRELGFVIAVGPEIESEWYNFFSLNFPADHPALDLHDTLYLDAPPEAGEHGGRMLLRTHTSPVQIRSLIGQPLPVRALMPGMVYRKDPFDPSHAPAFQQIEGLAVDEGISFVDLKATLVHFARRLFAADTRTRFRPSYFPFTEPSAEMDVECQLCHGAGCGACKGTGWMEILGCGMVHPRVLQNCGVDAERYTGWAFGMGPGRITMNRYGITDIRHLYDGDMRVLSQLAG